MMASHSEMKIVRNEEKTPNASQIDNMAQPVQNFLNLKFSMIRWISMHRLTITKAITELPNSSRSSGVVQNRPRGGRRSEDKAMVFYEKNSQPSHYRRPLYVTAIVHDMEHALVDLGSSMNIMPLSMLEAIGISRSRLRNQSKCHVLVATHLHSWLHNLNFSMAYASNYQFPCH